MGIFDRNKDKDKNKGKNKDKKDPLRDVVMKIFDPNIDSPDVFFKMDEAEGNQILRKYDKSSGEVRYAGTYEILFKTEDLNRFCLIMTRIANEKPVDADLTPLGEELDAWIAAEYSPGTHGRIYLKALSQEAVERITGQYEKKLSKRNGRGRER